jgi:protein gp37
MNREAAKTGKRLRVFPSLCDWLDPEVPADWLADFLRVIHETTNLDWLLLTKRPEHFQDRVCMASQCATGKRHKWNEWTQGTKPPSNVWVGVSVENQTAADNRIAKLLDIPASVRFLSVEPLLERVDLRIGAFNGSDSWGSMEGVHWVIVGGETGPDARPCNVAWIRDVVRQCRGSRVPCFVKQLGRDIRDRNDAGFDGDPGEWPMDTHYREFLDNTNYQGAPVRVLLKDRTGSDPSEWPEDLRVREWPGGKRQEAKGEGA